jgi:hypothetical protein
VKLAKRVALGVMSLLLTAPGLYAQDGPPGTFELGGGIRRVAQMALGREDADLTASAGGAFTLFSSRTLLEPATAFDVRLGVRLSPMLQVEVAGSHARPNLATRIESDVEGIPDVTARERLTQWTIHGALVAHLAAFRLGSTATPFVLVGAGYIRELHEGRTLTDTGRFVDLGGGVSIPFALRPDAGLKAAGLRVEARAHLRAGGAAFDDDVRVVPGFGASLFLRF